MSSEQGEEVDSSEEGEELDSSEEGEEADPSEEGKEADCLVEGGHVDEDESWSIGAIDGRAAAIARATCSSYNGEGLILRYG